MTPLNWKLILGLSASGLLTAAISIWGGVVQAELWINLIILLGLAMAIAAWAPGRYFLHGFWVGTLATLLEAAVQLPFLERIAAHNPDLNELIGMLPEGVSLTSVMVVLAPFVAPVVGLITGLAAWLVAKFLGKQQPGASAPPPAAPPQAPPPM